MGGNFSLNSEIWERYRKYKTQKIPDRDFFQPTTFSCFVRGILKNGISLGIFTSRKFQDMAPDLFLLPFNHSKPTLIKKHELQGSENFREQRTFLPLLCSLESCHPFGFHSNSLLPDPRTNCSHKFCSLSRGNCSLDIARILPCPFKEQLLFMCRVPSSHFAQGHPLVLSRKTRLSQGFCFYHYPSYFWIS